jgi:putative membrane protein
VRSPFLQLLVRWLVLALGVTLATKLVPGIHCDDGGTLLVVAVLLSFFTLPFIILTMGLGVIVINALLFYWVGRLVEGFHVASFRDAVGGSIVVSLTNLVLSFLMRRSTSPAATPRRPPDDDAIDV